MRSISTVRAAALVLGLLAFAAVTVEARPYQLAWDQNTDGLTRGYRVYYGTASGAYQPTAGIDVGNVTLFTVDLTPGARYFFVVRAYGDSGVLGPPSTELSFTVPFGPDVSVNTASIQPGGTISASITGGPGVPTDWVGFFPSGAAANGSTDWKHLNGTRTPPLLGMTSGTVSFVAPSTPGIYVVRFYSALNVLLSSSISITVSSAPTVAAPASVTAGQTIPVTVTNGPANRYDMVALYPGSSTSTSAYIDWKYLNGTQVAPASGSSNANVTFTAPTQAGQYFVRFMYNNGSSVLATSGVITVVANTAPTVTPSVTSLSPGSSFIARILNGPAGRYDWVGLFPIAASSSSTPVSRYYLNGSLSAPATGVSSANVTFTAPQLAGQYNLRFFPNNGTTATATSATITVTSAATTPAPTVTASATNIVPGGSVTAQVRNGPAGRLDWVGLFQVGASNGARLDWFYLNGSKVAPATGSASANVVFRIPTAGQYNLRLFTNSGSTPLATSAAITVTSTSTSATVTPSATTVARGSLITITVTNGSGSVSDWVGIYPPGYVGPTWVDWAYLNGTKVPPNTATRNATFTFRVPAEPGTYVLRLYGGTSLLASSVNILVQ